jgi:SAM-dependent methyltransferase
MTDYQSHTYGDAIAGVYDDFFGDYDEAAITVLADLAQGGRALELGIGTGRIALPLQQRGVAVHGIDASEAMVARLRAKPGGETLPVTLGDFAGVPVDGPFSLVYVVANTFFGLLTQAEQVRCFENVARVLARPGGVFALELFVFDPARYVKNQAVHAASLTTDQVRLNAARHDPANQIVTSQDITISAGGVHLYPVRLRYAWPSELDLMARLAGLSLLHRWDDWQRAPFTAMSGKHVSVYGFAA